MWAYASQTGVKVRGQLLGISSLSTMWVETDQVIGFGDKCLYSLSHLAGFFFFKYALLNLFRRKVSKQEVCVAFLVLGVWFCLTQGLTL